jgi:hypothetical protein
MPRGGGNESLDDRTYEGASHTKRSTWPIPNPLAVVAPAAAVAAAALAVAPLVAAERFVGGRRDDDGSQADRTDADIDPSMAHEGSEPAPGDAEAGAAAEVTPEPTRAATETLDGADPIALDSRRRTGRDGTRRDRTREERSERGERSRRRTASEQSEAPAERRWGHRPVGGGGRIPISPCRRAAPGSRSRRGLHRR